MQHHAASVAFPASIEVMLMVCCPLLTSALVCNLPSRSTVDRRLPWTDFKTCLSGGSLCPVTGA